MHPFGLASAMAVIILFGLPIAAKHIAVLPDAIGIFDPITCAMANSGQCTRAEMIEHRNALLALASSTG
jgi:hypothetical protein